MIPSRDSGWGTSIIVPPAFWAGGRYYQGTSVTATWRTDGVDLMLVVTGSIGGLSFASEIRLSPPVRDSIVARISTTVSGSVRLDNRPGEAFKPVVLSSMRESPMIWDAWEAYADSRSFSLPIRGWIVEPPAVASVFALRGGTSAWKTNAPTLEVISGRQLEITGWATESNDPNDDNIGYWAAASQVLPSSTVQVRAIAARCSP
jgi:hypothetical protein